MILKRIKKIKCIKNLYYNLHFILFNNYTENTFNKKLLFFSLFLKHKLLYYSFCKKIKFYNFSNGRFYSFLKKKKLKALKKSRKTFLPNLRILKKEYSLNLSKVSIFFLKNFNLLLYYYLKLYMRQMKPKVDFFFLTKNWNYIKKKKKRIKRKIYKNLLKKSIKL